MVWHQKHCGKGCFGACHFHKWSFDIFVPDAGKLHLPLDRMLRTGADGVAWHSSAREESQMVAQWVVKVTDLPATSVLGFMLNMQSLLHISNKGVEESR